MAYKFGSNSNAQFIGVFESAPALSRHVADDCSKNPVQLDLVHTKPDLSKYALEQALATNQSNERGPLLRDDPHYKKKFGRLPTTLVVVKNQG